MLWGLPCGIRAEAKGTGCTTDATCDDVGTAV